jgi:hypothetical protein
LFQIDYKFETPDPEEAKKKAAEAMQGAGEVLHIFLIHFK